MPAWRSRGLSGRSGAWWSASALIGSLLDGLRRTRSIGVYRGLERGECASCASAHGGVASTGCAHASNDPDRRRRTYLIALSVLSALLGSILALGAATLSPGTAEALAPGGGCEFTSFTANQGATLDCTAESGFQGTDKFTIGDPGAGITSWPYFGPAGTLSQVGQSANPCASNPAMTETLTAISGLTYTITLGGGSTCGLAQSDFRYDYYYNALDHWTTTGLQDSTTTTTTSTTTTSTTTTSTTTTTVAPTTTTTTTASTTTTAPGQACGSTSAPCVVTLGTGDTETALALGSAVEVFLLSAMLVLQFRRR